MVKKCQASTANAAVAGGSDLTVTAQQSRFHTEAAYESISKEILVKDLSISVGSHEVLSHADLHLIPGRHYVLVGRNDVGKSTLLRAIAEGLVPGIARSLRVLLLGQTQGDEDADGDGAKQNDETVFQHVIRSDKERERLLCEAKRLSEVIENTSDTSAMIRVYREISHERIQRDVAEARERAGGLSGAIGFKARKTLLQLEDKLSQASKRLEHVNIRHGLDTEHPATVGEETQKAYDMSSDIQSSLEMMDAFAAEAKARSVLLGLGFSAESLDRPMSQLSDGWQTRCSLACALCQSTDLLLLDEPTNFLDLPSIAWLEQYIQTLDPATTVIIVTHDRGFADSVGDELLVLRNLLLEHFRGSLSDYEGARLKAYKYLTRMKDAQEKQKKHMQGMIDQNVEAAKRARDDKKLKQAASRRKRLDERMGMQVSAKGTKFKLNRDLPGFHDNRRKAIEVPDFDPPSRIVFPNSPSDLRFPGALVSFENVDFKYKQGKDEVAILCDINFTMHLGDRVGVVGLNGSGKSTLVSLAMASVEGALASLTPSRGSISRHTRARFGLYSQQAVEELNGLASVHPKLTALAHLMETTGVEFPEKEARRLLVSLGLAEKVASEVPITLLSGGQKIRLALAKLLWTPPHLLILDVVTTHLDSDTIQALAIALRSFEGAILVITHDRFFMRCVVEGESPESLARNDKDKGNEGSDEHSEEDTALAKPGAIYRLSKTKLTILKGGMQQYEDTYCS